MPQNFKAKKSFGQNFLTDEALLLKIATQTWALGSVSDSTVIEIGAGLGALTDALLQVRKNQGFLVAIERDRDLIPILKNRFKDPIGSGQLELLEADAVKFLKDLSYKTSILCGNLPYHLTSSILFETLKLYRQIRGAIFLIQKEVADRIASKPNSKTYGLLSVLLQSRFEITILEQVDRKLFNPSPQVDSCVIRLKTKSTINESVEFEQLVFIVKKAFSQRRKKLSNTLGSIPEISSILNRLNLSPNLRAENLSYQDFERITECL